MRRLREAIGWTQGELAAHAGTNQGAVSRLETGGGVSVAIRERVTEALNRGAKA